MRDNRGHGHATVGAVGKRVSLEDRFLRIIGSTARSVVDLATMLSYRADLYRSRQDLRNLSDEHLRDVGITRRDAEIEASRPFFPD